MAIVGIGVDVCSVERWRRVSSRRPGVMARTLTPAEAALSVQSQAARFAAKEALAKALGGGDLPWLDAEVVRAASGAPGFELRGKVLGRAEHLGVGRIHLSMSHDAGVATAFVVLEGDD